MLQSSEPEGLMEYEETLFAVDMLKEHEIFGGGQMQLLIGLCESLLEKVIPAIGWVEGASSWR